MPQYKISKKGGKLLTYTYAKNTKAQIDYVFINKKWNDSALNCEAYSSFDGASPITELSRSRYDLAYERMWPEQPQPYTMTGPHLTTEIVEINICKH